MKGNGPRGAARSRRVAREREGGTDGARAALACLGRFGLLRSPGNGDAAAARARVTLLDRSSGARQGVGVSALAWTRVPARVRFCGDLPVGKRVLVLCFPSPVSMLRAVHQALGAKHVTDVGCNELRALKGNKAPLILLQAHHSMFDSDALPPGLQYLILLHTRILQAG
jgi:hypothetical protein